MAFQIGNNANFILVQQSPQLLGTQIYYQPFQQCQRNQSTIVNVQKDMIQSPLTKSIDTQPIKQGYDQMTTQQYSPIQLSQNSYFLGNQNLSQNFNYLNSYPQSQTVYNQYEQTSKDSIKQGMFSGQFQQQSTHLQNFGTKGKQNGEGNDIDIFFQDQSNINNIFNNTQKQQNINEFQYQNNINMQKQQSQQIQMIQQQQLYQQQQQYQQQIIQQQYLLAQEQQKQQIQLQFQQQQQQFQNQQAAAVNYNIQNNNNNENSDQQNNNDFDIVSLCNFEDRTQDEIFLMNYQEDQAMSQQQIMQKLKLIEDSILKQLKVKGAKSKQLQLQQNQLSILYEYHNMDSEQQRNIRYSNLYNRLIYCQKISKNLGEDYQKFEDEYGQNSKKPVRKCKNKYNTLYQCNDCKILIPKALIYFHCKFFHNYVLPKIQEKEFIKKGYQKYEQLQKKIKIEPETYNENTFLQIQAVNKAFSQEEDLKLQQKYQQFESNFLKEKLKIADFKSKNGQAGLSLGVVFSKNVLQDLLSVIISPQNNMNVNSQEENKQTLKKLIQEQFLNKDSNVDMLSRKAIISIKKVMKDQFFELSFICQKKIVELLQLVGKINKQIIKQLNTFIQQQQQLQQNQQLNQLQKQEQVLLQNVEKFVKCIL